MGLAPIQIVDDPRREPRKEIHVFESYNDVSDAVIMVIAVVEGVERQPRGGYDDEVREWTAYWMAFACPERDGTIRHEDRVLRCRNRGNKIPRLVAEAMFPRLSDYYFRE